MTKDDKLVRNVAAAERTLSLLDAFLDRPGPQSLGDLEKATGLFKSVIFRYMLAFEKFGYVHKTEEGHYRLTAKVLRLGMTFEADFDIIQYVRPIMQRLSETTQESSIFYVREGDQRLCVARVDSPQSIKVTVRPGTLMPLDATAVGQVIQNYADYDTALAALSDGRLPVVTSGISEKVTASVCLPIFRAGHQFIGALSVSGPILRFDPADKKVHRALIDAATELTSALGEDIDYAVALTNG